MCRFYFFISHHTYNRFLWINTISSQQSESYLILSFAPIFFIVIILLQSSHYWEYLAQSIHDRKNYTSGKVWSSKTGDIDVSRCPTGFSRPVTDVVLMARILYEKEILASPRHILLLQVSRLQTPSDDVTTTILCMILSNSWWIKPGRKTICTKLWLLKP